MLTSLFAPVPEFGTRVKEKVPVALVDVSVEIVMEPLPEGPAASQPTVGDVTNVPVNGLVAPTVCVPTCAGELKAMVVAPGLLVPDTMRKPFAMAATVIVPVHAAPSIVAVIVPGLRLDPLPAPLGLPGFPSDPQAGMMSRSNSASADLTGP